MEDQNSKGKKIAIVIGIFAVIGIVAAYLSQSQLFKGALVQQEQQFVQLELLEPQYMAQEIAATLEDNCDIATRRLNDYEAIYNQENPDTPINVDVIKLSGVKNESLTIELPEADLRDYSLVAGPYHDFAFIEDSNAPGSYQYHPFGGYFGEDSILFTYKTAEVIADPDRTIAFGDYRALERGDFSGILQPTPDSNLELMQFVEPGIGPAGEALTGLIDLNPQEPAEADGIVLYCIDITEAITEPAVPVDDEEGTLVYMEPDGPPTEPVEPAEPSEPISTLDKIKNFDATSMDCVEMEASINKAIAEMPETELEGYVHRVHVEDVNIEENTSRMIPLPEITGSSYEIVFEPENGAIKEDVFIGAGLTYSPDTDFIGKDLALIVQSSYSQYGQRVLNYNLYCMDVTEAPVEEPTVYDEPPTIPDVTILGITVEEGAPPEIPEIIITKIPSKTVIKEITKGEPPFDCLDEVAPVEFADIKSGYYAYDAIQVEAAVGYENSAVTVGYPKDGERVFKRTDNITRAEFNKMIVFASCYIPYAIEHGTYNDYYNRFPDNPAEEWYSELVNISANSGLVVGIEEDGVQKFKPNQNITRAEAVKIIVEIYLKLHDQKLASCEDGGSPFRDVRAGDWYCDHAKTAYQEAITHGTLDGVGNHLLRPNAPITRAETAVILYNFFVTTVTKNPELILR